MSLLDEYNAALQTMDCCSVVVDPLQSYVYTANEELSVLNLTPLSISRTCQSFLLPALSDICVDTIVYAPSANRIFTLNVDLRLFQNLFWYKNYDSFARYVRVNRIATSLLKSVNFLNARYYNGSTYTTLVETYLAFLGSGLSELHPYVAQKINVSLYQRLSTILETLSNESLQSIVSTILYTIGSPAPSSTSYSRVPLMEGDILRFYGTIVGTSTIAPFLYGIDLVLTLTIPSSIPDYSSTSSSAPVTDTFIMLPMTNGTVSNSLPITNLVRAYIPVNLEYTLYKSELMTLYTEMETTFADSLAQADAYFLLASSSYLYELYAVSILTQIALYYRSLT